MNTLQNLISRNIKLYFRDKTSVFFSLLSVIIIIALYALFLGDIQVQNIEQGTGRSISGARWLVNAWILAGTLAVSTVTVSLGAYGTLVDDMHLGQFKDFFISPVKRPVLVAGYMVSSALISLIMNTVAFILSEAFIVISGGKLLSPEKMLEAMGIITLSVISFSALICFITTFIRSPRAFGTFSTILGTMIGFLTGIYVPIGILPDAINSLLKLIPFSYSAVWLRQIFTEAPMAEVFAGAPAAVAKSYADFNGVHIYFGDAFVEPWMMAAIIAGSGILFFALSIWKLSKRLWTAK